MPMLNFSASLPRSLSRAARGANHATPPPGTTPSSTAARVACRASSTLAFFSFINSASGIVLPAAFAVVNLILVMIYFG